MARLSAANFSAVSTDVGLHAAHHLHALFAQAGTALNVLVTGATTSDSGAHGLATCVDGTAGTCSAVDLNTNPPRKYGLKLCSKPSIVC